MLTFKFVPTSTNMPPVDFAFNFSPINCAAPVFGGGLLAPICQAVRLVVVVDVPHQKAGSGFLHDDPNITTDTDRPKIVVLRFIDPVETHSRVLGIDLQIKHSCFDRLLLGCV
ncbi:hypothetical protein Pan258_35260 [Symmachiella dynata]|nr:hypothetical protein Pan258_35260 [Symmachiella dynata]